MPIAVAPTISNGLPQSKYDVEEHVQALSRPEDVKSQLKSILADVLQIELDDLDQERSFLALGGDSLLAIKVMARCKAKNIPLNIADVIDTKSIAELCQRVRPHAPTLVSKRETFNGRAAISPPTPPSSVSSELSGKQEIDGEEHVKATPQQGESGARHLVIGKDDTALLLDSLHRRASHLESWDFIHSALVTAACTVTQNHSEEIVFHDIVEGRPRPGSFGQPSALRSLNTPSRFRIWSSPFQEDTQLTSRLRDCASQPYAEHVESHYESFISTQDQDCNNIIVDVRGLRAGLSGAEEPVSLVSQQSLSGKGLQGLDPQNSSIVSISFRFHNNTIDCSFVGSRRWQVQYDFADFINVFKASLTGRLKRLRNDRNRVTPEDRLETLSNVVGLDNPSIGAMDRSLQPESRPKYSTLQCSPMQEGFLISQATNPHLYQCCYVLGLKSNTPGMPIDARKVGASWTEVVKRHTILRTSFIESQTRSGHYDQVIHNDFIPPIEYTTSTQHPSSAKFSAIEPVSFPVLDVPHRLHLAQASSNEVYMKLEISHALVDGQSTEVLLRDLCTAYLGAPLSPAALPYVDTVSSQDQAPTESTDPYWSQYLSVAQPCFLPMDQGHETLSRLETLKMNIDFERGYLQDFCGKHGVTLANVCQLAWSLVLRCFTGSDCVCFSYITSGRSQLVPGIHDAVGPFVITLPCCFKMQNDSRVEDVLKAVFKDSLEGLSHSSTANVSFKSIRQLGNTTMSFQRALDMEAFSESAIGIKIINRSNPTDYDVALGIEARKDGLDIDFDFWRSRMDQESAQCVLDSFRGAIDSVLRSTQDNLSQVSLLNAADLRQIAAWNYDLPEANPICLHEQVAKMVRRQPNAPAVCAWDGDLTYHELYVQASSLAFHLAGRYGVKPEVMVGICMDKSKNAIIAMLAVLQAGGVVVPFGVSHPLPRIETIIRDTAAGIMLVDSAQASRLVVLDKTPLQLVTVDSALLISLPIAPEPPLTPVIPGDFAWVIFTSGSTGIPKGVVLSHTSLSTSVKAHGARFGVNPSTRAGQFAAYTFDVSISDIFCTLHHGGCVCVFSEDDRMNNLTQSLQASKVNFVNLTPTVIRLLDPANVPLVKTLVAGGEPLDPDIVRTWVSHAKVFNSYGPSECSIMSTVHGPVSDPRDASNVGFPTGTRVWVAQSTNIHQLCPVGASGELLVEGPMLSRGYLNDPKKTAALFIEDPIFMAEMHVQRGHRLYRTGDLVRQNKDGSLTHLGRRDTQVKIRGQRVEIDEIEHWIAHSLADTRHVMVLVTDRGYKGQQMGLVAVVEFDKDSFHRVSSANKDSQASFLSPTDALRDLFSQLRSSLFEKMPAYMVPNTYVPVLEIPLNVSGKLDRRAMREIVDAADPEQLRQYLEVESKAAASTRTEQMLQSLWAEVLAMKLEVIGVNDHFFQIGGDSVTAIRLVAAARDKHQLRMTVADIIQHPQLSKLASVLDSQAGSTNSSESEETNSTPFSLWSTASGAQAAELDDKLREVAAQCGARIDQVEDVYPCTPLQEGLMAITSRQPTAYVSRRVFSLGSTVDAARFKAAWQTVADSASILRTRILFGQQEASLQTVVREQLLWQHSTSLEAYLAEDRLKPMTHGQPLNRFGLVEESSGEKFFVWTAHHSTYDGWSMSLTLQQVTDAYLHDKIPRPVPYTRFIHYLAQADMEVEKRYWREQLQDAVVTDFPALPSANYQPRPQSRHKFEIDLHDWARGTFMMSDVLRAAWALVSAQYADHKGSVFAVALSGRNAPVADIASLVAPTITTVPLHVRIDRAQTVQDFLRAIQEQSVGMIPREHTGLQKIKQLVPELKAALDLRHLFLVQPAAGDETGIQIPGMEIVPVPSDEFDSYGLNVECTLGSTSVKIDVRFDEKMVSTGQIERLMGQFAHVTRQLCDPAGLERQVGNLELVSPQDIRQIKEWNRTMPPPVRSYVHQEVEAIGKQQPEAMAVCAWDGNLTYQDLTTQAATLAHHLVALGVGPEIMVCLCMDKSKWATISMLAILQAGGVVVPLGTGHPLKRTQSIVEDTAVNIILVDQTQAERLSSLADFSPRRHLITVDWALMHSLPTWVESPTVTVTPDNLAWIVYTSGSTGIPKGVMLEHLALCSSLRYLGARFGMGKHTRTIQFAAHTFDAVIQDVFATLMWGGTVCIPSEEDRMSNLAGVMRSMSVNFANLTSTVARLMSPSEVPTMRTMVLAGEPVQTGVVEKWYKDVGVLNSYGPSECSINSTCNGPLTDPSQSSNVGLAMGTRLWVAEVNNPDRLCSIGVPGELLIEGPLLARGYLKDTKRTLASFITDPAFTANPELGLEPGRRMYCTGDLVRQNEDGTFTHIGRHDTQIKIRGQRVEINEIEYWISKKLDDIRHVAVIVTSQGQGQQTGLTAVVEFAVQSPHHRADPGCVISPPTNNLRETLRTLRASLLEVLPVYMVPATYIPIRKMPLNMSDKLDRRAVNHLISALPTSEIQRYTATETQASTTALTDTERQLQSLWAQALGIDASSIGASSHFFEVGGDSVAAMRIVVTAREKKVPVTVAEIFEHPQLSKLAEMVDEKVADAGEEGVVHEEIEVKPFEMLEEAMGLDVEEIGEVLNMMA